MQDIAPAFRWMARDCDALVVPSFGRPVNLVRRGIITSFFGTRGTEFGEAIDTGVGTGAAHGTILDGALKTQTEVTLCAIVRPGVQLGDSALIGNVYTTGTQQGYTLYFNGTGSIELWRVPDVEMVAITPSPALIFTHWYAVIARSSAAGGARVFVKDLTTGNLYTGTGTHTSVTTAGSGQIGIGYDGATYGEGVNGFFTMAGYWHRAWTLGQMMQFIYDPFAWLRARRIPQPVYKSGSVSATVTLGGVAVASAIGAPTILSGVTVSIATGVSATSAVGTSVATAGATIAPSGVICNSALGTLAVTGTATISPFGVGSTSGVGAPSVDPFWDYLGKDSVTRADSATSAGTATEKGGAWTVRQNAAAWGVTSGKIYSLMTTGISAIITQTYASTPGYTGFDFNTNAINTHIMIPVPLFVDTSNFLSIGLINGAVTIATKAAASSFTRVTVSQPSTGLPATGAASGTISVAYDPTSWVVQVYLNGAPISGATYTLTTTEHTAFGSALQAGVLNSYASGTTTASTFDNWFAKVPGVIIPSGSVSATGAAGAVTVTGNATVTLTGVACTSAIGAPTVVVTETAIGVAVAAAIGTLAIVGNATVALTGVQASSALGTPTGVVIVGLGSVSAGGAVGSVTIIAQADVNISLGGVSATSAIGTPTITDDVNDAITGVQATAAVALVSVSANATVALTGISASSTIGAPTVGTAAVVTGVQVTSALGTVAVHGNANVTLTGVAATSAAGTVSITTNGNAEVTLSGVVVGSAVGPVLVVGTAHVMPSGVAVAAAIGTPVVTDLENASIAGVQAIGSIGLPAVHVSVAVAVSGVGVAAAIGHPIVTANASLEVGGVIAYGALGIPTEAAGVGPEYTQSGRRLAIYRGVK